MKKEYIELRVPMDIGEITGIYLQFLKQNFRSYLSVFIRYNGPFIIAFLIANYLLISGMWGDWFSNSSVKTFDSSTPLILGILLFILLYFISSLFNYSLAAGFLMEYTESKGRAIDQKNIMRRIIQNIGRIIVFVFFLTLLYFGVMMVGMIVSIVPVVGLLGYYLLFLGYTAWTGLSFTAMFHRNIDAAAGLSFGWALLKVNFWKAIFVNLIITLILGVMMMAILMIPGFLMSFYGLVIVDNFGDSVISLVLSVLALTAFMTAFMLYQSFSQFVNGILYFSLFEERFNEAARERIEQIGVSNE